MKTPNKAFFFIRVCMRVYASGRVTCVYVCVCMRVYVRVCVCYLIYFYHIKKNKNKFIFILLFNLFTYLCTIPKRYKKSILT